MAETLASIDNLAELALLAALASTRFALAFLLQPLFAPETVPQLVRAALFLTFGIVTLAVQPPMDISQLGLTEWLGLFAKEAFLGLALGLLLAAILWAFDSAGAVVDGVSGMSMAQIADPLSGRQVTLSSAFLGRLAVYIFMFSGGLMLWVGMLIESFSVWPLAQPTLVIQSGGVVLFENAFAAYAGLMFMIAAPVLVVLYAIDLSLGLMNRYAPQLNLITISISLKGLAAALIWLVLITTLMQTLLQHIAELIPTMLDQVRALFGESAAPW